MLKKRIMDEAPKPENKEGESEVVEKKEKPAEDEVRGMGTSDWQNFSSDPPPPYPLQTETTSVVFYPRIFSDEE